MFASITFQKIPCPKQSGDCESVFCPFNHTLKREFPIEPAVVQEQPAAKKIKTKQVANPAKTTSDLVPPTTKASLDAKTSLAQVCCIAL
jgi:hypothetical protein